MCISFNKVTLFLRKYDENMMKFVRIIRSTAHVQVHSMGGKKSALVGRSRKIRRSLNRKLKRRAVVIDKLCTRMADMEMTPIQTELSNMKVDDKKPDGMLQF